jgi:hypothetical protein
VKLILELEGVGYLGVNSCNYIFFTGWQEGSLKNGKPYKTPVNCKYFMSLGSALEEMRCYCLGKKLAFMRKHATSIDELLAKIDKINKDWDKFYHEKGILCEDELKVK